MRRAAVAASIVTTALTGLVMAGIPVPLLPERARPVLLITWGAAAVITVMLWLQDRREKREAARPRPDVDACLTVIDRLVERSARDSRRHLHRAR